MICVNRANYLPRAFDVFGLRLRLVVGDVDLLGQRLFVGLEGHVLVAQLVHL